MSIKFSPKYLIFLLLMACAEEDPIPPGPWTQLLLNTNISLSPDSVLPWKPFKTGDMELGVSKEIFMTGNQSLFIEKQDSLNTSVGGWNQIYTGTNPAQGSRLELMAFLKGENIKRRNSEHNIYISFNVSTCCDAKGNQNVRYVSSRNDLILEGDFDWTPIRITMDNFPANAGRISVALSMPYTVSGKIYFDEINLIVR